MTLRLLPALSLAACCLCATSGAAPADPFLVVPGHRIGQTTLGPNGSAMLKRLPRPAAQDSGMMQSSLVWVSRAPGRADTLFVHTVANAAFDPIVKPVKGVTISEIRVTSRQFHTQSGISTASTLAQVRQRFPEARADRFNPAVYDDSRRGIAFEFAQPVRPSSRCIGISVIKPSPDSAVTTQSQVNDLLKEARVR